jgi:hypothetical protein
MSQRPSELDSPVLSQFAMRLANELDKGIKRVAAGASASSTVAFLPSIADYEAIASPLRMRFADPGAGMIIASQIPGSRAIEAPGCATARKGHVGEADDSLAGATDSVADRVEYHSITVN